MKIFVTCILYFLTSISAHSQFVDLSDSTVSGSSEITFLSISPQDIYKVIHYSLKTLKNGNPAIEFILVTERNKTPKILSPNINLEISPIKSISLVHYRDSSYYNADGSLTFISIQVINRTDIAELKINPVSNLILFENKTEKIKLTSRSKQNLKKAILSFFRNYT
jgi:hypothetical protein